MGFVLKGGRRWERMIMRVREEKRGFDGVMVVGRIIVAVMI